VRIRDLTKLARNLRRHASIVNHGSWPIHTGRVEGINTKTLR